MFSVFAHSSCDLGEGIFFDKVDRFLYWLDINNSLIYRKNIDMSNVLYDRYKVGDMPSAILSVRDGFIEYVDRIGICFYEIKTGNVTVETYHCEALQSNLRTNDGVILSSGQKIFGTMNVVPTESVGDLFVYADGKLTKIAGCELHIPNTFIELKDGILISDSLTKIIYKFGDLSEKTVKIEVWSDFSKSTYTPDGGCVSSSGLSYVAMWGGAFVAVFDSNSNLIKKIELPVLNPSNCVLVDNRYLFVTSAREGLSDTDIKEYPLSGSVIKVDLEGEGER
jgi:sugar lactone lactonase YvrE